MSRYTNLNSFEPIVRVVPTAGTPVPLSPYIAGSGFAFTNNGGASDDTITDTGSGFVTAGFLAGDKIKITGSGSNASVRGFTLKTVAAGTLTLEEGGVLTDEVAGTAATVENLHGLPVPDGVDVLIRALPANTGEITIAPTSARALNTATGYYRHCRLTANQTIKVVVKNLKDLWIDATVSGEGVEVVFEK